MKKNLVTAAATAGLMFTAFGASASAQENTYTVQPGDSLWKIAQLHNVSINQLKDWNNLSSDRLFVNQKLSLTYSVKTGDSLWAIAKSYGTTVKELKSTNGLTADLIRPGLQLKIPSANVNVSATVPTTNNNTTYVIQKGDTLSEIGARYNLTVSELKSMNQLTSNRILAGNILKLRSERANAAAAKDSANSTSTVDPSAATSEDKIVPATSQNTEQQGALEASQQDNQQVTSDASQQNNQTAVAIEASQQNNQTAVASEASQQNNQTAAASEASQQNNQTAAASEASQQTEQQAAPKASQPVVKPAAPATSQANKVAPAPTANVQAIVNEAKKYIGTPYLWGGNNPSGFDCSGFVKYVFNKFGVSLPRTTSTQWGATTSVNSPSVGDLVFFETYKSGPSHVGIYLGNNQFISATDSGVKISNMTSSYWGPRYLGAKKAF